MLVVVEPKTNSAVCPMGRIDLEIMGNISRDLVPDWRALRERKVLLKTVDEDPLFLRARMIPRGTGR
jgi:hypothetical protein